MTHPSVLPPLERQQGAELQAMRSVAVRIAAGAPLEDLLGDLCLGVEELLGWGRCCVLLLQEDGVHMAPGAGPHLPFAYLQSMQGLAIGPQVGSCGTAMFHRRPVAAGDIATDPRWGPFREAALHHGLKACASLPILGESHRVLGSFALYRDGAGSFPDGTFEVLERFTPLGALAIQSHHRTRRLLEGEARLRVLVEQSREGIFLFDATSHRILDFNPAFQAMVGFETAELHERPIFDLIAHDPDSVRRNIALTLDTRHKSLGVRHYRRKDGSLFPVEVAAAVLDWRGRKAISVVVRDISERLRQEQERELQAERYREAQALGHVGHWTYDLASGAISWSEELFRIFRRDPAQGPLSLEEYQAAFRPEDWALVKAYLDVALATGEPQTFDVPLHWPDGTVTWHRAIQKPVVEDGRPVRIIGVVQDITERKSAEDAMLRAAQELKEAQVLGRMGSWTMDLDTGEVAWSPEMYRLFNRDTDLPPFSAEEAERIFVDDQGKPTVRMGMVRLRAGEARVEEDTRLHLPDGTWRDMHSVVNLVHRDGRAVGLRGTLQDITERKSVERALQASEARFRIVAEQTDQLVYDLDIASGAITWEGAITSLTGYSRAEFQALDLAAWEDAIHPDDRAAALAELARCMATLAPYQVTYRFRRRDGSHFWTEDRGAFLDGGDGQAVRMLGTMSDITGRLEAEADLRRSERVFRDLFEASPLPMALLRARDGVILRINPGAMALFDLEADAVGQSKYADVYVSLEERQRIVDRLEAEGSVQDSPADMRTRHGVSQILVSANRLTLEGEPCILLGYRDITAQQREEDVLRQSQKLESLGVLAGGIAHDFNNLLTAILGNLNLAQLHFDAAHPAHSHLHHMETAVHKAADLARQMLAYSGRGRFRLEPVDLGRLGQEMAQLLAVSIPKKVRLDLDLPEGLGTVNGDPTQLQQVLMNLVTNGSEAIAAPEGTIRVGVSRHILAATDITRLSSPLDLAPGPHLCLEVRDNGVGMSREVLERIFDPFFTTKATGRGLGLSAMLGIIRGHHGGLDVTSSPQEGTTFRVFLPCTPAPAPAVAHGAAPEPGAVPMQGQVLLADDEPPVRYSVAMMLNHLGYTVIEAQDGLEALACFEKDPGAYACAILDLTMPRMDGREALARMREVRPDLPVLLSSGYSDQGEAAAPLPRVAFLAKPYRLADLQLALLSLLEAEA